MEASIETRLRSIERSLSLWRTAAILIGAILIGRVFLGAANPVQDELDAKSLRIFNDNGDCVATVAGKTGSAVMTLTCPEHKAAVFITADAALKGPMIELDNAVGQGTVVISGADQGGAIGLYNAAGARRLVMQGFGKNNPDATAIFGEGGNDETRFALMADPDSTSLFMQTGGGGAVNGAAEIQTSIKDGTHLHLREPGEARSWDYPQGVPPK